MWKFKFYVNEVKEEQWINDMCQQGWHLQKFYPLCYQFEQGTPSAYIYRNEMIDTKNTKEYLQFLEEADIEVVHRSATWIYTRKPASEGPFELYSDVASKLNYTNRLLITFLLITLLNLMSAILNLTFFISDSRYWNGIMGVVSILLCILLCIPLMSYYKRRQVLKNELI